MSFKIFYSWQSKTHQNTNRDFIGKCLGKAIKKLKIELKDDSPDFYLDRDTKDLTGIPNIPKAVEDKIKLCDLYLSDLTYVMPLLEGDTEGMSAPNVLIETGFALANPGEERIITIMNEFYGARDKLPFDIKQRRFPISYTLPPDATIDKISEEAKKLTDELKKVIQSIFENELEKQKTHFYPFLVWRAWEKIIDRPFKFIASDYINSIFKELRTNLNNEREIYRFCGLSGIGKTRMLFECFFHKGPGIAEELTNKVLYVDSSDIERKDIIKTVKDLLQKGENKILFIDNCSKELHISLTSFIRNEKSRLSLLTVSIDPDETSEQLDIQRVTKIIKLDSQECKATVANVISENFNELQTQEQELFIEFSSGIAFIATLMRSDPDRGNHQPGSLKREDIISRLLGSTYSEPNSKAIIEALCLFSTFGFFEDLEYQSKAIAQCDDLCSINFLGANKEDIPDLKNMYFQKVCNSLHKRQLLEKKGRVFAFRPTPLAVRMAEKWWLTCSLPKFNRILPILKEANLVEAFCEQFRYLKHIEHAQTIVGQLCEGVFSSAEVLNTEVGSRLFRSFVYVNPVGCTKALTKAFGSMSNEEALEIKSGRRNLVWALEKLCFRPETFAESVKIMALFGAAENEAISNNARGQFLQLFHIHLPGTKASLKERLEIIDYCIYKDKDHETIGISAMDSALLSHHFMRMGGSEDQGDIEPLRDFIPSQYDIFEYWQSVIDRLKKYALQHGEYQKTAIAILLEQFYGLCSFGAGNMILSAIEELYTSGQIDKPELRSKVNFIIGTKRIYDPIVLERLKSLRDIVKPETFEDIFLSLIKNPGTEEYYGDINDADEPNFEKKIDEYVRELVRSKPDWKSYINLFTTGQINEGYNFGKVLATYLIDDDFSFFIEKMIEALYSLPNNEGNYSVLLGCINGKRDLKTTLYVFDKFLYSKATQNAAFIIARSSELPFKEFCRLITLIEEGIFTTFQFRNFDYGWGMRHFSGEQLFTIFERVRKIDNGGKISVFFTLSKWCHNDKETWLKNKKYLRELVLEDSEIILQSIKISVDHFNWDHVVINLLKDEQDQQLAEYVTALIFKFTSILENYNSMEHSFYKIIDLIQEKYFSILWHNVINAFTQLERNWLSTFHLNELLGSHYDYRNTSVGLLVKSDSNFTTIFGWAKLNRASNIEWIARLLPAYDNLPGDTERWHPFAKSFIDEFGDDNKILLEISATMSSYSWTGSLVPKLQSDVKIFNLLLDHPKGKVRDWAVANIANLEKRIHWEQNRDEDGIWY